MNKAVFLDRDGTINVDKNYLYKIEDWEFIDGVIEGLQILQRLGFKLIVITNQSGIARGYYTEEDAHKIFDYMIKELEKRYDNAYKKEKDIVLVTYSCIAVNSLRIFIAEHDLNDNKFYQIIKDDSNNITTEVISIDNNGKFQTKLHNKGILNSLNKQLFKLLDF